MRIGVAKSEAGRAFGFVQIHVPDATQAVTRARLPFPSGQKQAQRSRAARWSLLASLQSHGRRSCWGCGRARVQLTQIESVFRSLKSELGIRPVYHRLEHRVDAHPPDCFSGLLPPCDTQESTHVPCTWSDAKGGDGEAGRNSNDRRMGSSGRWPLVDSASIHAAGNRHQNPAAETQTPASGSASSTNYGRLVGVPFHHGGCPVDRALW